MGLRLQQLYQTEIEPCIAELFAGLSIDELLHGQRQHPDVNLPVSHELEQPHIVHQVFPEVLADLLLGGFVALQFYQPLNQHYRNEAFIGRAARH